MDSLNLLQQFLMAVENDPTIAPRHIAVYTALIVTGTRNPGNRILALRTELMRMSAIHSRHTYNCTMRELHTAGYILYEPSYYAGRSRVTLLAISNN
mgnify:CR=1 FL=1